MSRMFVRSSHFMPIPSRDHLTDIPSMFPPLVSSVVSIDSCDILMNGYAWRIQIWHDKEHAIRLADEKAGIKPMLMGNVDPA